MVGSLTVLAISQPGTCLRIQHSVAVVRNGEEIAQRKDAWQPLERTLPTEVLGRYARHALSASQGAGFE